MRVCSLSKNCSHVDGYLCEPNTCLSIVVDKLSKWLGKDGISFFRSVYEDNGRIDAVYPIRGIPHSVHFSEGMQVRNFLRELPECKEWTAHDLDNKWVNLVKFCIDEQT